MLPRWKFEKTLEKIIVPSFQGAEKYPPDMRIRVGQITNVNTNSGGSSGQFQSGTIQVQWLDHISGSNQLIKLTFPSFSNPIVNTDLNIGSSYGLISIPSAGDLAVCGFRDETAAVVLGYLPHNYYQQTLSSDLKNGTFGTWRDIVAGEYSLLSLQQAEAYLDRAGAFTLSVKQQPTLDGGTTDDNPTPASQIDTSLIPGKDTEELANITVGLIYDPTFTTPVIGTQGSPIVLQLKHTISGTVFNFDALGNATLQAANGTIINLTANGGTVVVNGQQVNLNATSSVDVESQSITLNKSNALPAARKTDPTLSNIQTDQTFWTMVTAIQTFFTALSAFSGGSPVIQSQLGTLGQAYLATVPSAPTQQVGKINNGSSTVKVG